MSPVWCSPEWLLGAHATQEMERPLDWGWGGVCLESHEDGWKGHPPAVLAALGTGMALSCRTWVGTGSPGPELGLPCPPGAAPWLPLYLGALLGELVAVPWAHPSAISPGTCCCCSSLPPPSSQHISLLWPFFSISNLQRWGRLLGSSHQL